MTIPCVRAESIECSVEITEMKTKSLRGVFVDNCYIFDETQVQEPKLLQRAAACHKTQHDEFSARRNLTLPNGYRLTTSKLMNAGSNREIHSTFEAYHQFASIYPRPRKLLRTWHTSIIEGNLIRRQPSRSCHASPWQRRWRHTPSVCSGLRT